MCNTETYKAFFFLFVLFSSFEVLKIAMETHLINKMVVTGVYPPWQHG